MAFVKQQLAQLSTGANVDGNRWWSYKTTDTFAVATASAYFDGVEDLFHQNDVIYINASDDQDTVRVTSADGVTPITVTSLHGNSVRGTSAFGGGGTTHAIAAVGTLATDIAFAQIRVSTNPVSVVKVEPVTDAVNVTFSADPGAATVLSFMVLNP